MSKNRENSKTNHDIVDGIALHRRDLLKPFAAMGVAGLAGGLFGSTGAMAEGVRSGEWWRSGDGWADTARYKKKGPYRIAVFAGFLEGTWMSTYAKHIEVEAKRQGDMIADLTIVSASNKIAKQIEDIKDILSRGVDGIIVDALSPTALVPVCREVLKAGVPVVASKNFLEGDSYTQMMNDDGFGFGEIGASWLVEQLNGKGKIIMLRGLPGYGVDIERYEGAMSVFKEHPGIEIVAQEYGNWSVEKGKEVSKAMLVSNPKIDGAWSAGGQMSRGLVQSLIEAGHDMIPMSSEDENGFCKLWKQYKDQGLEAIATAKPVWQGGMALQSLLWILQGGSVPKEMIFPAASFTYDQLDNYLEPDLPDDVWLTNTLPADVLKEMFAGR